MLEGTELHTAWHLAVAVAIGLLIGLERERRKGRGPGRGAAGVRTFALAALLGGLAPTVGGDAAVVAGAVFVGAAAVAGYLVADRSDPGITTEVAFVVTYLLGALAMSEPALASAVGVVTTVMLAARERLHRLVRDVVTEDELHDLLLFATAAVVVLPLLPNRALGPYDAVNPFNVWRLVVLVLAVSGAGYISLRAIGPRFGLPLAGLAGGFVSSAATIGSMGSLSARRPLLRRPAVAGAVLSTVATILQMAVVLAATSEAVLREMAPALAGAGGASLLFGTAALSRIPGRPGDGLEQPGRAFDLRTAAAFAAILTAVLFAAAMVNDLLGTPGLVLTAAFAGFADTHAAAVSVAALVNSGHLSASDAVLPILCGLATNTITKAVVARTTGGWRFAVPVWAGLSAVLAAAVAGAVLARTTG